MRSALALALLALVAGTAAAAPLLPPLPPAPLLGAPAVDAATGCETSEDRILCQFEVDTRDAPLGDDGYLVYRYHEFDATAFDRTLGQATVRFEGIDRGWALLIFREGDDPDWLATLSHDTPTQESVHEETGDVFFFTDPDAPHVVVLYPSLLRVAGEEFVGPLPPSLGVFRISLEMERLPEGSLPEAPAANASVPHLRDARGDARLPELDIVAGWFDDARLGDRLMDAHLNLDALAPIDFRSMGEEMLWYEWSMDFEVEDRHYAVVWWAIDTGAEEPYWACELVRKAGEGSSDYRSVVKPVCLVDEENATLVAIFPERSVGSPAPAVAIRPQVANAGYVQEVVLREYTNVDTGSEVLASFALGGDDVWDTLNPARRAPPAEALAWHQAPFAPENVADTLQVAGASAALLVFVGGFVVVRRRRSRMHGLLARVRAIEDIHETNAAAGLLALGRLETDINDLHLAGGIEDAQYNIVTQRISAAAARLARRRDLGLDDGEPGDEPAIDLGVKR